MTARIAATFAICFVLTFINAHAQEPVYLGSIPSDTINSLFGTSILPLGDQNNDGFSDILVWDIRRVAQLFQGGASVSASPQLRIDSIRRPRGPVGDVDSDGYDDIAVQIIPETGDRMEVYHGGPGIDTLPDEWFGVDSMDGVHLRVIKTHDINHDGSEELLTQEYAPLKCKLVFYELDGAAPNKLDRMRRPIDAQFVLKSMSNSGDSIPDLVFGPGQSLTPSLLFGESLVVGDFNGDGFQDLGANWVSLSSDESGAVVFYWGGPVFDTLPDLVIRHPMSPMAGSRYFGRDVLVSPGDLNADGWDDVVVGSSLDYPDTLTFVYFGGPGIDSLPDVSIYQSIDIANPAGDINHDGYSDLIASDPARGHVSLYYGGPDFDSLYDFRIRAFDIPGLHFEFGMFCTGIGDYNGDGIDDFAFSGIDIQTGTVYIYAGFDGSTDAGGGGGVVLPVDFQLYQNYPNPFNPITTIAFTLPVKSHVEIDVFNVLGQRVATLTSAELPSGSHSVVWDGTDAAGDEVASGVYMYRLSAGEVVLSRKMVLAR